MASLLVFVRLTHLIILSTLDRSKLFVTYTGNFELTLGNIAFMFGYYGELPPLKEESSTNTMNDGADRSEAQAAVVAGSSSRSSPTSTRMKAKQSKKEF
jgi:hypothetical protein